MEKVQFVSNGQLVRGTLVTPVSLRVTNPGVILFHGLTSKEDGYIPIAQELADHGIVALTLSLRGHGRSEGDFDELTVEDAFDDGLSAYDFFAHYDFVDPDRIGILGTSVGGAIASNTCAFRNVRSLVLRGPATYTDAMMKLPYPEIEVKVKDIFQHMTNVAGTRSLQAITKFSGDLLVITSEKDDIVPRVITSQYMLSATNARSSKEVTIKGATHVLSDPKWRAQFIDEAVNWLVKKL